MGSRGLFLQGPEMFLLSKRQSKITNLMITELFYSRILDMNKRQDDKMIYLT